LAVGWALFTGMCMSFHMGQAATWDAVHVRLSPVAGPYAGLVCADHKPVCDSHGPEAACSLTVLSSHRTTVRIAQTLVQSITSRHISPSFVSTNQGKHGMVTAKRAVRRKQFTPVPLWYRSSKMPDTPSVYSTK